MSYRLNAVPSSAPKRGLTTPRARRDTFAELIQQEVSYMGLYDVSKDIDSKESGQTPLVEGGW